MMADYFSGARLMTWVIIFVGAWVIALALLLCFAARIDPRSGRWRRRRSMLRTGDAERK